MHIINRCTEYAILSLLQMASTDAVASAQGLSDHLGLPHPFLRGILRTLKTNHIIGSKRGQKGGFILKKQPRDISVLDLVNIFQGPLSLTECSVTKECSRSGGCAIRYELESVETDMIERLQGTTLQTFLDKKHNDPVREKEKVC